jgi:hypothetical protein
MTGLLGGTARCDVRHGGPSVLGLASASEPPDLGRRALEVNTHDDEIMLRFGDISLRFGDLLHLIKTACYVYLFLTVGGSFDLHLWPGRPTLA